jgi:hypothetical protein
LFIGEEPPQERAALPPRPMTMVKSGTAPFHERRDCDMRSAFGE